MIDSPIVALTEIQDRALSKLPIEIAQALLRLRDRVVARFPDEIVHFILYGSFARGEAHSESDVDVMIVTMWPQEILPNGRYVSLGGDPRRNQILDMAYDVSEECARIISAFVIGQNYFYVGTEAVYDARIEGIELLGAKLSRGRLSPSDFGAVVREPSSPYDAKSSGLTSPDVWFEMMDDKMKAARWLIQAQLYDEVIATTYYAVFYAAKAALSAAGVRVKSHSGAVSEFGKQFVATKRIAASYGRLFSHSMDARLHSDYEPFPRTTLEKANEAIDNAETFIAKARELVAEETSKK